MQRKPPIQQHALNANIDLVVQYIYDLCHNSYNLVIVTMFDTTDPRRCTGQEATVACTFGKCFVCIQLVYVCVCVCVCVSDSDSVTCSCLGMLGQHNAFFSPQYQCSAVCL